MTLEKFLGQIAIGDRTGAGGRVFDNALTVTRRFSEADIARNDRLVGHLGEDAADVVDDQRREVGAGVRHRHDNSFEDHFRVGAGIFDLLVNANDFRQSFEAEILALKRNDQLIGCCQRGRHEHAEGRRAIEEKVVRRFRALEFLQLVPEADQVILGASEFDFAAGQFQVGRHQREIFVVRRNDDIGDGSAVDQSLVDAVLLARHEAKRGGGVGLGIEVENGAPNAALGEAGAEIDGSGGLSDAAFLVGDGNDLHEGETEKIGTATLPENRKGESEMRSPDRATFAVDDRSAINLVRIVGLLHDLATKGNRLIGSRFLDVSIEAGTIAGVAAAGAVLADLEDKGVLIAIGENFLHRLDVTGGGALMPEFLAAAAEIDGFALFDRLAEGLLVHVGDHEDFTGVGVLGHGGDEAVVVESRGENEVGLDGLAIVAGTEAVGRGIAHVVSGKRVRQS